MVDLFHALDGVSHGRTEHSSLLVCPVIGVVADFQDGDDLESLNNFREGDDPQENDALKNADKFEEVESGLTFVGICGIKVS